METKQKIKTGDILVDTWGFEQTNKDFYKVIKRTGDFITIKPMTSKKEYSDNMTGYILPGELIENSKPLRKKLKCFSGSEGFTLRNYVGGGWCQLWDGQKEYFTEYA